MGCPARLALALTGVVFSAACGSSPAGQVAPGTQEAIVVVPPSDAAARAAEPAGPVPESPARPAAAPGDVEECIANLRKGVSTDDPVKAGGEADYHDALAAEREGRLDVARKGYFKVVQNHPSSVFVPASYFAFGEMFAADAKADPTKVAFAEQSYNEVLKFPAPFSRFRAVASYRLGVVLGTWQPQRALAALIRAGVTGPVSAQDSALAAACP